MGRAAPDADGTSLVPHTGTPAALALPALAPTGDPQLPPKSFVLQSRDPALPWEHQGEPPRPPKTGSSCGAAGRTDATGQLPQHRLLPLKTYNLHKTAIVKPSRRAVLCEEGGDEPTPGRARQTLKSGSSRDRQSLGVTCQGSGHYRQVQDSAIMFSYSL